MTTLQNQLGNYYIIITEACGKSKEIFNVFLTFKHFYWLKFICSSGKVGGIPTPVNDRIVRLIKEIQDGKRKIARENLKEIL